MLTIHEIANKVVLGLAGQGWRRSIRNEAFGSLPRCAYRGAEGMKCAVGHVIPDDVYTQSMETAKLWDVIRTLDARGVLPFLADVRDLLSDLQFDHDLGENMREDVKKTLRMHNLLGGLSPEALDALEAPGGTVQNT